jgi:hypothetical protein
VSDGEMSCHDFITVIRLSEAVFAERVCT